MMNRNWKLLGFWLALALLCACLFGSAALAQDGEPSLAITVTGFNDGDDEESVAIENEGVSGFIFYKVHVSLVGANDFQWTMEKDQSDQALFGDNPKTAEDWKEDETGYYRWFLPYGEDGGLLSSETVFFRLSAEDENVKKLVLNYNICDATPTITNTDPALEVMTGFTLAWDTTDVSGGQDVYYEVAWKTPLMDEDEYLVFRADDCSLKFKDGMTAVWGEEFELSDVLGCVGDYEAWVTPYVDGALGKDSKHVTFSVSLPAADQDQRVRFVPEIDEDESSNMTVLLNENFDYNVYAAGADGNLVEVYFGDGEMNRKEVDEDKEDEDGEENDHYGWDDGDHEYGDGHWAEFPHCYTAYARAQFDGEWVYSEGVQIYVDLDGYPITGSLTYTVSSNKNDAGDEGDPIEIARDDLVKVEVTNVANADYYEAYIVGPDDYDWRIASGRVKAVSGDKTTLYVPVASCEPGHYRVGVYAGRKGARNLDCDAFTEIEVKEPETQGDLMISMRDKYVTCEPLGISVYYLKPVEEDDVWMNVQIFRDGEDERCYNDDCDPEDGVLYFYDDGCSFGESGKYKLIAEVWQEKDNEEECIASTNHTFTVLGTDELDFPVPSGMPDTVMLGESGIDLGTLTMPDNGNYMSACIEVWGKDDLFDKETETSGDEFSLAFTKEDLEKVGVEAGDVLMVSARATGYNCEAVEWRHVIPVVSPENAAVNPIIAFKDEQETTFDTIVNNDVDVVVQPAEGQTIQEVRLFNGHEFNDFDPNRMKDGLYHDDVRFDEEGSYKVFAKVTYDPWDDEYETNDTRKWLTTDVLTVTVAEPEDNVPAFSISADKTSIERMGEVKITFTPKDVNKPLATDLNYDLWIEPVDENGNRIDEDHYTEGFVCEPDIDTEHMENGAVTLYTARMSEGRYRIVGYADKPGWRGQESDPIYIEVTAIQMPEDTDILFKVNGESETVALETSQEFNVSVYAPGAEHIDVYLDGDGNRDWTIDDGWDGEYAFDMRCDYDTSGTYTMVAQAWYPEENGEPRYSEARIEVNVTSNGKLSFDDIEGIPAAIGLDDTLSITIPMPGNATYMDAWVNDDNIEEDGQLFSDEIEGTGGSISIAVTPEKMVEKGVKVGDILSIHAHATAQNYEGANFDWKIPVLGTASTGVEIAFEEGFIPDAQGILHLSVNQSVDVIVKATDPDQKITAVRLFDGNDLRGEEGPDEDGAYCRGVSMDQPGEHVIYAMVSFDDNDPHEWVMTNTLSVKASSAGQVGKFTISLDKEEVTRGDKVRVTFNRAEHATDYWLNLGGIDRNDWSVVDENENTLTIEFSTVNLPAGGYRLSVGASGEGYVARESNEVRLAVKPVTDDEIIFNVEPNYGSGDEYIVGRNIRVEIYAPGAKRVGFGIDDDKWHIDEDGNYAWGDSDSWSDADNVCFDEPGEHTLKAYAQYEDDGDWTEVVKEITVEYIDSLAFGNVQVPESILESAGIAVEVPLPENADKMEGGIRTVHDWGESEDIVNASIESGGEQDSITLAMTADDLAENDIHTGDTLKLWVRAEGDGYESAEAEWYVPVTAVEGAATLSFEGDTANALVNQDIKLTVSAIGSDPITAVRLFDGRSYRNEVSPDENGIYRDSIQQGEPGTYNIHALVSFDHEEVHDWARTNVESVTIGKTGDVGAFGITLDPPVVVRGEKIRVEIDSSDNADQYALNIDENDWRWVDEESRVAEFSTINCQFGENWISARAWGEGYQGRDSEPVEFTVTDSGESEVIFNVEPNSGSGDDPKYIIGRNIRVEIYAPGAKRVGFGIDDDEWHIDEEGNYAWGDSESWSDANNVRFDEPGEHTLKAYAQYGDDDDLVVVKEQSITVKKLGDLAFDKSGLPAWLTAENNSFTVPKPANAESMNVQLYRRSVDDVVEKLDEWENLTNNLEITVPVDKLIPGESIQVDFQASAEGYVDAIDGHSMNVVSSSNTNAILSVENMTPDDNGRLEAKVNTNYTFVVSAGEGHTLKAVKFNNGYGWWDNGRVYTPSENGDAFENGSYRIGQNHGQPDTIAVYASVQLDDSEDWVQTNVITLALGSNGSVGAYDFIDTDDVTGVSGGKVEFTFSKPDNADNYGVSIWIEGNEEDYNQQTRFTENGDTVTVTVPLLNLPEGEYSVRGWANGEGFVGSDSAHTVKLTVTAYTGPQVRLEIDRDNLLTNENMWARVYAPGAEAVGFQTDEDRWDSGDWMGDTWEYDEISFGEAGSHTLKGWAKIDGKWVASDPETVTVTSDGPISIDLTGAPAYITKGQQIHFTVPWPDEAIYLGYDWWVDDEQEARARIENKNETAGDLDIDINTEGIAAGSMIHIGVWSSGVGYEHNHCNLDFPVVDVTAELEQADTYLINTEYNVHVTAKGTDRVRFWNDTEYVKDENGDDIWQLNEGEADFTVSYASTGDKTFYAEAVIGEEYVKIADKTVNVTSKGLATAPTVEIPETIHVGNSLSVAVSGVRANSWFKLTLDGEESPRVEGNANETYTVEALDPGDYSATLTFGAAGYEDNSATYTWTVEDHTWGDVTCDWTDRDNVTASRACTSEDCHCGADNGPLQESETVKATSQVTTAATCVDTGVRTWTATFENEAFGTKTDEEVIPVDANAHTWDVPVYTWAEDYTSVTATVACKNGDHPVTETVSATSTTNDATYTEKGATTYTAKFTNALFTEQTEVIEIPVKEKDPAVKAAEEAVKALTGNEGLGDAKKVAEARAAYEQLTAAQKANQFDAGLVDKLKSSEASVAKAEEAAKKAADDKAAADKVTETINALSASVGTGDKAAVEAARKAYSELSEDQQKLVDASVLKKLTDAEASVAKAETDAQKAAEEAAKKAADDKAAADKVTEAINALSASAGTGDKAAVEAARKAYDTLTEDQKKLVDASVLKKLTDAEASVAKAEADAQKAADDKAAADKAIEAIKALSESASLDDKDAVAAAKAAYDSLTDEQKKLVPEDVVKKLTAAEEQVKAAEEAARQINIADCEVTVENQTYTGKALTPAVTVKHGTTTLKADTDYALTYENNKNAGTATVTVTGMGSYTGSKAVNFTIAAVKMAKLKYTVKAQAYNGKAKKPAVTVKFGTTKLKKGTDYTIVSYKNNVKIGLATVTVKGKGNFTGSKKVTFKINPKGTAFTKLTGGKQQIVLQWKNPKNIKGYEIQYSLKKNFSGAKTVKIKKAKTLKTTIKKLKANTTYYVRVRTYATVSKKTYYSAWSKVKSVKTKGASANSETVEEETQATETDPETELDDIGQLIDLELDDVPDEMVDLEEAGLLME